MKLVYLTAAYASDWVWLSLGMVTKDRWLSFWQQKIDREVSIPFNRRVQPFAVDMQGDLDQLKVTIDAMLRPKTWLVTQHGKSRSTKAFSSWSAGAATAAGQGETAYGLRKARAEALAGAGATA